MPSRPRTPILYCKWSVLLLYTGGRYRHLDGSNAKMRHFRGHTCKNLAFSWGGLQVHYFIFSFDLEMVFLYGRLKGMPGLLNAGNKINRHAWKHRGDVPDSLVNSCPAAVVQERVACFRQFCRKIIVHGKSSLTQRFLCALKQLQS